MPRRVFRNAAKKKPDRLRTSVNALIGGVFVTLSLLLAANLWWRHQESLRLGEARAANLALILGEHLSLTLTAFETTLRQLAQHGERLGGPRAPASAWAILSAMRESLPGAGSISVVDESGTITHSTIAEIVGQSRRDLYLFQRMTQGATDDLIVDKPFRGRGGRLLIPLGRRLAAPDGSFAGGIVVAFEPELLRGFFKSVDVGTNGRLWVLHPAGLVLFREPSGGDPMGQPAPAALGEAFAAARGDGGLLRAPLEPSGPAYLTAYR
ncbi:MAG: hypothetical protein C3F17_16985, partial [Bradyrhizobiaceae bacterium]